MPLDEEESSNKNQESFRGCDPPLYDTLRAIVRNGARSVRSVKEGDVLPPGTVFYDNLLSFEGIGRGDTQRRLERRKAWGWDALAATRGHEVVFADPDNGLESGESRTSLKGTKYAYFDELIPHLDRGQSLIVYHHHRWDIPADTQVRERLSQINERLGEPFALRYLRGAPRSTRMPWS